MAVAQNLWFKNLLIYTVRKELDLADLAKKLQANQFKACTLGEQSKLGWDSPVEGGELYMQVQLEGQEQYFFLAHQEDKILPASVVKEAVDAKIKDLEFKQNRFLHKTEKQAIKDEVITSLLPQAFSKHQFTALWLDSTNQLIYINTSSTRRAENTLALLRKTLGTLPVIPLSFNEDMGDTMTQWLLDNPPAWLEILDSAELKGGFDDSVIKCKKQDLVADEILALLKSGKRVSQLSLNWEDNLSFTLKEQGGLSNLKYALKLQEENADFNSEDRLGLFLADFALMSGILSELIGKISAEFGGLKEPTI